MSTIRLKDVVVATVLPFTDHGAIDWDSFRPLIAYCGTQPEISTVFVNGHAGEGATLTNAERAEVVAFARAETDLSKNLIAGIIAYSTAEAVAQARDAARAGADGAVIFPMPQFAGGGAASVEAVTAYAKAVLDGAGLPVSVFQYPLASGLGYSIEVLTALAQTQGVEAIKEGSNSFKAYEDHWRRIKDVAPHVAVLPSNFDWFLAQAAVGADGILSGLASLAPAHLVDLWKAAKAQDLAAMRRAGDALYPIVRAIYGAPPAMDMHTRIKACLRHLGIIDSAFPRPPLLPLDTETTARMIEATDAAGFKC
jgi:4-hydroxy-tetrahydrodipicolinate synthase